MAVPDIVVSDAAAASYTFVKEHIKSNYYDVLLVEITKPGVELPFTTVIRDFREVGYLPIFTNFFISKEFGTCAADIEFLRGVWAHLAMEGHFDIDSLLRKATSACLPNGEDAIVLSEPIVYRRHLDTVKARLLSLEPVLVEHDIEKEFELLELE